MFGFQIPKLGPGAQHRQSTISALDSLNTVTNSHLFCLSPPSKVQLDSCVVHHLSSSSFQGQLLALPASPCSSLLCPKTTMLHHKGLPALPPQPQDLCTCCAFCPHVYLPPSLPQVLLKLITTTLTCACRTFSPVVINHDSDTAREQRKLLGQIGQSLVLPFASCVALGKSQMRLCLCHLPKGKKSTSSHHRRTQ
jgi:hypothetical protein